ncbi:serine/threonine-protein kinase [Micromonospora zhanjiangensis]
MALLYRAIHDQPDLNAVPPALQPVIAACLAKNPTQRPTPDQLLTTLTTRTTPHPDRPAVHGDAVPVRSTRGGADAVPADGAGAAPVWTVREEAAPTVWGVTDPTSPTTANPVPPAPRSPLPPTRRDAPPLVRPALPPTRVAGPVSAGVAPAGPPLVFEAPPSLERLLAAPPLFAMMAAVTLVGIVLASVQEYGPTLRTIYGTVATLLDLGLLAGVMVVLGAKRTVTLDENGLTVRQRRGLGANRELALPWQVITAIGRVGPLDRLRVRIRLREPVTGRLAMGGVSHFAPDLVEVDVPWPPRRRLLRRMVDHAPTPSDHHPDSGARILGQAVRTYAPGVGLHYL